MAGPLDPERLELRSGPPFDLVLCVERVGAGLRCRVTAPPRALGPAKGGAGEGLAALERHLVHRLARAAGEAVSCELDPAWTPPGHAVSDALEDLARRAAQALREGRLARDLSLSGTAQALTAPDPASHDELQALLATPLPELRARLGPQAARIAEERFGRRVLLFAPLYLSDACRNDCAYCGFRRSHARRRVHLSREEALAEARALAAAGLRAIDLVTGEVPSDPFVDGVARAVEAILAETPIERVNLNLGALSGAQYRRLHGAGATGYHLYQETYDPEVYRAVHREGPKRDLAWRLEAPERAVEAGFGFLGLGILLGLAEPARDLAALMRHGRALAAAHPGLSLGFSLPRLCAADPGCAFEGSHPVDDALFEKCLLVLRTRFPAAHLTLTTRERPALRDALLYLGPTKLSAGVSTAPGGYAGARAAEEQFAVADPRSPAEVASAVRAAGLLPVVGLA